MRDWRAEIEKDRNRARRRSFVLEFGFALFCMLVLPVIFSWGRAYGQEGVLAILTMAAFAVSVCWAVHHRDRDAPDDFIE